jgi:hypothetical protein
MQDLFCFHLKAFAWECFISLNAANSMNIKEKTVGRSSCHLFLFFYFFSAELIMNFLMLEHFFIKLPDLKAGNLLTGNVK